jgi:hypothetical protein
MVGTLIGRDFCVACDKHTKFERNQAAWGAGDLLLAVATLGLWGVLKFLINETSNPWRCSACGILRAAVALAVTVILAAALVWAVSSHLPDLPR